MAKREQKKAPDPRVRPAGQQAPRRLQQVLDPMAGADAKPVWRVSLLDHDYEGEWSWGVDADRLRRIAAFMTEMERLTWRQIWDLKTGGHGRRGALHKFIPVDHLVGGAQARLYERGVDFDQLFRFRLGNMERLWGVLTDEPRIFYPIWWDARHRICPGRDHD